MLGLIVEQLAGAPAGVCRADDCYLIHHSRRPLSRSNECRQVPGRGWSGLARLAAEPDVGDGAQVNVADEIIRSVGGIVPEVVVARVQRGDVPLFSADVGLGPVVFSAPAEVATAGCARWEGMALRLMDTAGWCSTTGMGRSSTI